MPGITLGLVCFYHNQVVQAHKWKLKQHNKRLLCYFMGGIFRDGGIIFFNCNHIFLYPVRKRGKKFRSAYQKSALRSNVEVLQEAQWIETKTYRPIMIDKFISNGFEVRNGTKTKGVRKALFPQESLFRGGVSAGLHPKKESGSKFRRIFLGCFRQPQLNPKKCDEKLLIAAV